MAKSTLSRTFLGITSLMGPFLFGCGWVDLGGPQGIGRPCDLSVDAGPSQATYNAGVAECPSQLCLKPVVQVGAGGPSDTGPTCSGECSTDSDCDGELRDMSNPSDTRCERGFVCGIPFVKGALCCRKLCVCKDFLGPQGAPTPIACQGPEAKASCAGTAALPPGSSPVGVETQTDAYISLAPVREIDIVTLVDNSGSMAPKIEKLNAAFPKLIESLRAADGTLPDLHLALIDSDLGTGGAYENGPCGPKDPDHPTSAFFGDLGMFQMPSAPTSCTFNPGALFLELKSGLALNYTGDISTVFTCLTGNLGTGGCFMEQPLQAFEFALAAQGVGNEAQQAAFLRPQAQLALLFLSDEDDCSDGLNFGVFGAKPELRGESSSLRCATRAHMCGGRNLTVTPPGYPTTGAYVHPFADCRARTDACPSAVDQGSSGTDASGPTACSPLLGMKHVADAIRSLKGDPDQILVAGIFGWPRSAAELATAEYKIAPVPNLNVADTEHPTVFDYWPVCYDPNHLPAAATMDPITGFDATAAAWGATGGLRESAFIDEFGANGLRFSICEPDFGTALATIGGTLARKLENRCFDYKLVDTDPSTPGIQADCRVAYLMPAWADSANYLEGVESLPACAAGATDGAVTMDCWQIDVDRAMCPATGQRISVLRTAEEIANVPQLPARTKLRMQCRTCPAMSTAVVAPGCDYSL